MKVFILLDKDEFGKNRSFQTEEIINMIRKLKEGERIIIRRVK